MIEVMIFHQNYTALKELQLLVAKVQLKLLLSMRDTKMEVMTKQDI